MLGRFHSDRQRRAMFRRMAGAPVRARQKFNNAKTSTLTATAAGALGASMAPWVTHLEGYDTRAAVRRPASYLRALATKYPQMGTYAAIPAAVTAGALALQHRRDRKAGRKTLTKAQIAKRIGTAGAVGFGGWLGERALVHSIPAFMNQPFAGRPITKLLRAELLLGHGIPLAVGAGAIGALAHRAARKQGAAREIQARERIKGIAPVGAATLLGHWFGLDPLVHKSGVLYNRPRLSKLYYKGVDRAMIGAAVPAYLAYRMLRRRRELEAQRRAA